MTALVTGASGHMGANLVRELLSRGERVRVLVREDTRAIEGLDVERASGDLLDPAALRNAVEGVSSVFHCAALVGVEARAEAQMQAINVEGTRALLEVSEEAGVGRFVHFSTVHALQSDPRDAPMDETRPLNDGPRAHPYERTKARAERAVLEAVDRGLHAVIVNPTGGIGPHDYKPSRMGDVLLRLARGTMPGLIRGGYDWVDVRDVATTAIAAAERGRAGERYLLSGRWYSMSELVDAAGSSLGARPPRMVVPLWMGWLGVPFSTAWAALSGSRPLFCSGSMHMLVHQCREVVHDKATRELGHQPRPIEETLVDALDWYRSMGWLPSKESP